LFKWELTTEWIFIRKNEWKKTNQYRSCSICYITKQQLKSSSESKHIYSAYFFRKKISHPGKVEKSRVTQRITTTTNRIEIVHSCQLNGPSSLYCCLRIDCKFVRDSTSFALDLLHRKSLNYIVCIMKNNLVCKTSYPLRLYKICSHNQQRTSKIVPIGKPYKRKLANEIWSLILPLA
jgi:hypothetical protein